MNKDLSFLKENVIAHRGVFDNKKIPENSIKAFKDAISKNYVIELDVHLTIDGKVVVFHDDTLERMTNKKGDIKDFTFEELRKTKLLDTNYTIPSFEEVLDIVNGKVPLLIELKYDVKKHKLEKKLIEILDKYKGEFAIQSFSPSIVRYFRVHRNNIIRGLLVSSKRENFLEKISNSMIFIPYCKPDFLSIEKNLYNNSKVKKFRKNKLVLAWTMKSKDDVKKYKGTVDNLICNIDFIK